jgi:uncharacterized membrane protein
MGVMMPILPIKERGAYVRWLLLTSLVVNVVFMGAAGAVALRYTGTVPLTNVMRARHNMIARLNEIAATLPSADADLLRAEIGIDERQVATAQADLRLSHEAVRNTLRAEPFDPGAMRAAMAADRQAHENFEFVLHDVIAAAVAKMSVGGRNKLADFSSMSQRVSRAD